VSAQVRLFVVPKADEEPVPVPEPVAAVDAVVRREWSCGCVSRGVWVETREPDVRWFLSRGLVHACGTRVGGKSCDAIKRRE
jgi:hypothetical protein